MNQSAGVIADERLLAITPLAAAMTLQVTALCSADDGWGGRLGQPAGTGAWAGPDFPQPADITGSRECCSSPGNLAVRGWPVRCPPATAVSRLHPRSGRSASGVPHRQHDQRSAPSEKGVAACRAARIRALTSGVIVVIPRCALLAGRSPRSSREATPGGRDCTVGQGRPAPRRRGSRTVSRTGSVPFQAPRPASAYRSSRAVDQRSRYWRTRVICSPPRATCLRRGRRSRPPCSHPA